jgi:hypothetical protein
VKISQLRILFFCLSISGLALAQDSGPSLGEAAKQAQPAAKAKIVITDDNVAAGHFPSQTAQTDDGTSEKPADASAPVADAADHDGAAVAPDPTESADHIAARKRVENLQTVVDREQKAAKESEEKLAAAETDSERSRNQAALDSHREHLNTLGDDLRDAQVDLKNTPFSTKPVPSAGETQ